MADLGTIEIVVQAPVEVSVETSGAQGKDGASAYEVAVANGFVGTEQDWLDSLKQISADAGNTLVIGTDSGLYAKPPQLASAQW